MVRRLAKLRARAGHHAPAYRSEAPIVPILMGAFGAQALIAGTFAAFSQFTKRTFIAYGVVLLPFFAFDYYFYAVEPMLTEVGLLDAAGNLIMLALCYLGWRAADTGRSNSHPHAGSRVVPREA